MKTGIRWTAAVLVLAVYAAAALWFAVQTPVYRLYRSSGAAHVSYERALVVAVKGESLEADSDHPGLFSGFQDLDVRILTGPQTGQVTAVRNFLNYTTNYRLSTGSQLVVHVDSADADHQTV